MNILAADDQVRGVAAKLFTVRDGMFCQALNTAAGGKLFHVVINTEEVSSFHLG
jgi:chromosome segregation ATPase